MRMTNYREPTQPDIPEVFPSTSFRFENDSHNSFLVLFDFVMAPH